MPGTRFTVTTTLAQAPARDRLDVREVVVGVGADGRVTAVEPAGSTAAESLAAATGEAIVTEPHELLLPGLIDLHVHAPQWPQLGTGLDLPLDRWLFEHTFPLESRYRDAAFAQPVWDDLVTTLLAHGTTTAVYFATIDVDTTSSLAETCARHGQRAFVGRVAMDHPAGTPPWYRDDTAATAIAASAASIDAIRGIDAGRELVQPIVTPRFTPACTDELLRGLADLAERTATLVQTHVAESDWVSAEAVQRFGISDTAALHRSGLLRRGTVLAHGNHVGDEDAALITATSSGIAHCPLSNAYFAGAVLPVRHLLDRGVHIGLGTDVAGGASPSLLRQCHDAVTVSRLLDDGVDARRPAAERGVPGSRIDTTTAFWMATVGAAEVLGEPIGLIEPGRRFDAVLIDTRPATGALDPRAALRRWPGLDDPARTFEKVVRLAGGGDVRRVWVDGRPVRAGVGSPGTATPPSRG